MTLTEHKYTHVLGCLALRYCLPSNVPKMEKYKRVNIIPWKLVASKTLFTFSISAFLNTTIIQIHDLNSAKCHI
jgi:hypothetical protein